MKKLIGFIITTLAITLFLALIPLIFVGDESIISSANETTYFHLAKGSYLTGNLLFTYVLIFGIFLILYKVIINFRKYFNKDLHKIYLTIANIIFWSIILGGILGIFFPKHSYPCYSETSTYCYEFNFLFTLTPIIIGIFVSLVVFGKYLSKE
jgi:hypothetical protein